MRIPSVPCLTLLVLCLAAACGLETEPNPDFHGGSGGAGTTGGTHAGTGGRDAGGDAGGEGGTVGGSAGTVSGAGGLGGAGSGGVGDDGAVADCDNDGQCPATRPQCSGAGVCVKCTASAACEDRDGLAFCETTITSPKNGQCVACLEDDHCEDNEDGEYCNNNTCVPCRTNSDCTDLSKPQCGTDGQCTGCTSSDACVGRDETKVCVTAAGASRGHCVGCIEHSDCDNPSPQCADNECKPCTSSDACEDRNGATVCDTSSNATFGGTCVECTSSSFSSCGTAAGGAAYVCNVVDDTCSNETVGSAQPCQPCIADAHCRTGTVCMQTKFGATNTGNFCLWRKDADGAGAPDGSCLNVRPYLGTESTWKSIEGDDNVVCKPAVTTCQAQSDFRSKSCSGTTTEGHAQCGAAAVDDAYCAPFETGFRCTVPCVSFDDCKDTRPGDDMECQSQMLGAESIDVCAFQ